MNISIGGTHLHKDVRVIVSMASGNLSALSYYLRLLSPIFWLVHAAIGLQAWHCSNQSDSKCCLQLLTIMISNRAFSMCNILYTIRTLALLIKPATPQRTILIRTKLTNNWQMSHQCNTINLLQSIKLVEFSHASTKTPKDLHILKARSRILMQTDFLPLTMKERDTTFLTMGRHVMVRPHFIRNTTPLDHVLHCRVEAMARDLARREVPDKFKLKACKLRVAPRGRWHGTPDIFQNIRLIFLICINVSIAACLNITIGGTMLSFAWNISASHSSPFLLTNFC